MNKRIKELIDKATTIEEYGWGASYENFDREKFAELIVRDVISEIGSANTQHCAITTYDLGIVNCTESKITNHLLSTFGYIKPGIFNATNS